MKDYDALADLFPRLEPECRAITRAGNRCKITPGHVTERYCHVHWQPSFEAESRQAYAAYQARAARDADASGDAGGY